MSATSFKQSLALVLAHEGGFVNNPRDPGGATNCGVTQAVYDAYRKLHGLALRSVRQIDPMETKDIYISQYWRRIRGDELPAGIDYAVFDFAVNSGVSRAIRYLQRQLGVDDDGSLGNVSIEAVFAATRKDEEMFVIEYCANRVAFLRSLATFPDFGKGWVRRVMGYKDGVQVDDTGVIDYAIKLARADQMFVMPAPIELPKAIAPIENKDVFPVMLPAELVELAKLNDTLAIKLQLGKLA
jgi:lysozyme family protein